MPTLAFLSPLAVTLAWCGIALASSFLGAVASGVWAASGGGWFYTACVAAMVATYVTLVLAWPHSLYLAATFREPRRPMLWVFYAAAAGVTLLFSVHALTGRFQDEEPSPSAALGLQGGAAIIWDMVFVVVVLSIVASQAVAAAALVMHEKGNRGSVILTFLAIFHLPIGIWFLWRRLNRLKASISATY